MGPGFSVDHFAERGLRPSAWDAAPGQRFGRHAHVHAKLLTCRQGSIRFTLHPQGDDVELSPGDWIELPGGQEHSAVVGPSGVTCEEAFEKR